MSIKNQGGLITKITATTTTTIESDVHKLFIKEFRISFLSYDKISWKFHQYKQMHWACDEEKWEEIKTISPNKYRIEITQQE